MGYRYIGTKSQAIRHILSAADSIAGPGAHVTDLMCGTGSVALAFRGRGYRVTANDVMTYSYHHARVLLLFAARPAFRGAQDFIRRSSPAARQCMLFPGVPYESLVDALNAVPPHRGYFWREFSPAGQPANGSSSRNYFSPENAAKIDGIRLWIRRLHDGGDITDLEHSLLLHDLIMAANDVANIAGTYGHYLSRLIGRAKDPLTLRATPLTLMQDSGRHTVIRGFAEQVAAGIECDLCYIDPPYMKRQYAANYHILETIAREDEPEAAGQSGLRPWRDQYSLFCTKTRIREAFRLIFTRMSCNHFLISYSEDGLLSIDDMQSFLREFGRVQVARFRHKRFRSNNSSLAPYLTEYLLHLETR